MVENIGKITKKDYCPKCFTLVEWDVAQDQFTSMGNRYVICPNCGSRININDAEVLTDDDGSESGGAGLPEVTAEDNGDVLTVVNGAWDKASPSGGGGSVLIVNIVDNVMDKTFNEIKTAIMNGTTVIAYQDLGEGLFDGELVTGVSHNPTGRTVKCGNYIYSTNSDDGYPELRI